MKVCRMGALHLQIMNNGNVRPCEYMVSPEQAKEYGSLLDSDIKTIYHSEQMEKLRCEIVDGKNYSYCRKDVCEFLARKDQSNMVEIDSIPEYPLELNLAYDTTCNYKCTSCIFHSCISNDSEQMSKIEHEVAKVMPYVKSIISNGCGEVFASRSIMNLLSNWVPLAPAEECKVMLLSNGSLFDEKHWKQIENIGKYNLEVHITVHSFDEDTYQYLSGTKLSIKQVVKNLYFVKKLRKEGLINRFVIPIVVQERNFRELPHFIQRCIEEFEVDEVEVRGYEPWGAQDKNVEWFFNVRNPNHPYYNEYLRVMENPIFKNPKVFNWMGYSDSRQGEIPAKSNYDILKSWCMCENAGQKVKDYLVKKGKKGVVLYGISEMAEILYKLLTSENITVKYIMDKYTPKSNWNGLEVKHPRTEIFDEMEESILVTLVNKEKYVKEELINAGYKGDFLNLKEIL